MIFEYRSHLVIGHIGPNEKSRGDAKARGMRISLYGEGDIGRRMSYVMHAGSWR